MREYIQLPIDPPCREQERCPECGEPADFGCDHLCLECGEYECECDIPAIVPGEPVKPPNRETGSASSRVAAWKDTRRGNPSAETRCKYPADLYGVARNPQGRYSSPAHPRSKENVLKENQ